MNSIIFLICTHMSSFGFVCIFVTQSIEISRDRKFSRPWHHERVQFDLAQWAGPRWCVRQVYSHEWTSDHASGQVPNVHLLVPKQGKARREGVYMASEMLLRRIHSICCLAGDRRAQLFGSGEGIHCLVSPVSHPSFCSNAYEQAGAGLLKQEFTRLSTETNTKLRTVGLQEPQPTRPCVILQQKYWFYVEVISVAPGDPDHRHHFFLTSRLPPRPSPHRTSPLSSVYLLPRAEKLPCCGLTWRLLLHVDTIAGPTCY
nr:uncharacterized protein LOC109740284 isoform X1 [Aegilops tauschii subsp. strangulata]